jgi:hypothetical protein
MHPRTSQTPGGADCYFGTIEKQLVNVGLSHAGQVMLKAEPSPARRWEQGVEVYSLWQHMAMNCSHSQFSPFGEFFE